MNTGSVSTSLSSNLQSLMAGQSQGSQHGLCFWLPDARPFTGMDIATIGPGAVMNKMINMAAQGGIRLLPVGNSSGLLGKLLDSIKGCISSDITFQADGLTHAEISGSPFANLTIGGQSSEHIIS